MTIAHFQSNDDHPSIAFMHRTIAATSLVSRFIYVDGEVILGIPCALRG
jgi:hypothetical protein